MDLATLIKPILTAGDLRVIGSTTFEEFKHIEKDRALARRLQQIAIEEPSIEETVQDPRRASRPRTRRITACHYTDAALEAAAKLAARHLRDLPAARQRHRRHRRGRRGHAPAPGRRRRREPGTSRVRLRPVPSRRARRHRGASSRAMARIPARQASSSDRERLRTLEESLERVVFGQDEAVHARRAGDQARRAPGLGQPDRPAGLRSCSRARPASARRSWPSSSRSSSATSSSAST